MNFFTAEETIVMGRYFQLKFFPLLMLCSMLLLCSWSKAGMAADEYKDNIGEENHLHGVVLPVNQSKLSFTQSGVVTRRPLEGMEVKKGDVLARIDDAEAKIKMAKAKASLKTAQITLKQAVREHEKTKLLIEKGIMSDTAVVDGEDTIKLAEIGVEQATLDVASAKYALNGCKLLAPFDGAVVSVATNQGEWIGAGTAALEFVDLSHLELSMDISPKDMGELPLGSKADIFIAGKAVGWAEIHFILPMVDAASGLRRLIWTIHPNENEVVTGQYINLKLK
jgi:RND family efflux transporter MFP subunit